MANFGIKNCFICDNNEGDTVVEKGKVVHTLIKSSEKRNYHEYERTLKTLSLIIEHTSHEKKI